MTDRNPEVGSLLADHFRLRADAEWPKHDRRMNFLA